MKFCSQCAYPVYLRVPDGDNLPRHVCAQCGTIHYQNPKIVTGCIPEWEDRILLCKRAIEPRSGTWTLPAGFMENNESVQEGAIRETMEEANARVEITQLYSLFNIPYISQVYLMFRARLQDLEFKPGVESLEVRLFRPEEIPWHNLSFSVIRENLLCYLDDRSSGTFRFHTGDITREMKQDLGKPPR